ncbi:MULTISPECIES: acetamidase/formamidase family protein [unclassified Xanthomonas]|uniref:acetamidase/formamidase family protein n=1 Tax=unclassified Xanthomonas TaxID=2643310 RepID=UPI002B2397D5|nr:MULTISPECIES: acetamidase/formamidase family protein [unclassified Xanthomonas]MEA9563996.1 acetamidase/formamidase family protein [Xanthomonas sp. WHRI 8932A]MEA9634675.1 acetamidase/formamidase family protein [Xanthomonas sp. WHRI 8812E]
MPISRLTAVFLAASTAAIAGTTHAETWIVRTDLWGNPVFSTLSIDRTGNRISGDLDGDTIDGGASGDRLTLTATDRQQRTSRYVLRLKGKELTGTTEGPDTNDPAARATHAVTGWRVPDRDGGPRTVEFSPTDYSNTWNADRRPVLIVWPGDTIHTTTVDSGGVDAQGKTRALFGNPQTGPFFVAGAQPGDTLAVHIRRLKLNRDWADSLDSIVGRALGAALVPEAAALGKPIKWRLDRETGRARPENATGPLAGYSVPVKPMLGGMAVAPGFGMPAISTGDTGRFGGNMDFNEVVEGNTVYLPVQQPGALLYFGDAHALQGDGETTQYALETSMDVTVTVDLIKGRSVSMPRVESPTQIMVLGQAGSLDEALKSASTGMVQWLQQDYGLTLSQSAQVLGTAMHYSIPNLAGRSVGVAAKIDKALLPAKP